MSWKDLSIVDQRKEFVLRSLHEDVSFQALCQEYGISRKTGYKWQSRFMEKGLGGLADKPRRPESCPNELTEAVVCEIVRLKQVHRSWGPRKVRELYLRQHGLAETPSESSFKRVLDRAGLVEHRRRRPALQTGRLQSRLVPQAPNDLWTVDFKGCWYTCDGQRCEPLTVRDAYSRFLLCVAVPPDATTQSVQSEFENLFERYGLPGSIRSDNGRPFAACNAPLGLSSLSAWWVALGIDLDRTDPGHPEQNGGHERMHRDIARELEHQIDGDLAQHSEALELWRRSFNQERPHEALGMKTPAEVYQRSSRRYEGTPESLEYPAEFMQRWVSSNGEVQVEGRRIRVTAALAGWNVGLKAAGEDRLTVYFGRLCLGQLDLLNEVFVTQRPEPTGGLEASGTPITLSA